jgi:hypothetical protein
MPARSELRPRAVTFLKPPFLWEMQMFFELGLSKRASLCEVLGWFSALSLEWGDVADHWRSL